MLETISQGIVSILHRKASEYKNKKILDIGCGMGDYTSIFGQNNNTIGLDIQNVVKKEYKNFTFKQGDATKIPFKTNSFDLVTSFDVIEHIEQDTKMVKESYRILKKNGRLFFGTPNRTRLTNSLLSLIGKSRTYPLDLGNDPNLGATIHIREYTAEGLSNLLKKVGFKRVKIYPYWFGLSIFPYGFKNTPLILQKYCQYLFVEGYK